MSKTSNFPIRIDNDVIEKLKLEAKQTGRTTAGLVRFIIDQHLKQAKLETFNPIV